MASRSGLLSGLSPEAPHGTPSLLVKPRWSVISFLGFPGLPTCGQVFSGALHVFASANLLWKESAGFTRRPVLGNKVDDIVIDRILHLSPKNKDLEGKSISYSCLFPWMNIMMYLGVSG